MPFDFSDKEYRVNFCCLKRNFIPEKIQDYFVKAIHEFNRDYDDDTLTNLLVVIENISGSEIEANEVSLGLVIGDIHEYLNTEKNGKKQQGALNNIGVLIRDSLPEDRILSSCGSPKTTRKILKFLEKSVIGLAPGHYGQPIIICDINHEHGLLISDFQLTSDLINYDCYQTAHEVYSNITRGVDNKNIGIWIKPNAAIRIYGKGNLRTHIMELRDIRGWAVRSVENIVDCIYTHLPDKLKNGRSEDEYKTFIYKYLVYPSIALSEEKLGGAIYILTRETWLDLLEHDRVSSNNVFYSEEQKDTAKLTHIKFIHENELSIYHQQDGALVIDKEGYVLAIGAYFVGLGGRKTIANEICNNHDAIALVTSQDGGIFFYSPIITIDESDGINNESDKKDYIKITTSVTCTPEEVTSTDDSKDKSKRAKENYIRLDWVECPKEIGTVF